MVGDRWNPGVFGPLHGMLLGHPTVCCVSVLWMIDGGPACFGMHVDRNRVGEKDENSRDCTV